MCALLPPLDIVVLLAFLCATGFSQSSPAAGPWTGWVQCVHDIQAQGYQRRETQTWQLTSSSPTGMNGDIIHLYSASWKSTGSGFFNRTDGARTFTGQWTVGVSPPRDVQLAIFVRPDGKLIIRQWGSRQHAEHAVTGTRQVAINGMQQTPASIDHATNEWVFPVILEAPSNTQISGSSATETDGAHAELMPQFAPQRNANCKWEFARGANASVPPPPGDTTASNPPGSTPPGNNPPGSNPPAGGSSGSQPANGAQLLRVEPNTIEQGEFGKVITLTGASTHWMTGKPKVTVSPSIGYDIGDTDSQATSDTSLMAALQPQYTAAPGPRTVTVTNGSEVVTLPNAFTMTQRDKPVLLQITPNTGAQGQQSIQVHITGQNTRWAQGKTTVKIDSAPPGPNSVSTDHLVIQSVTVQSPTALTAVVNIDPARNTGTYWVSVTNTSPVSDGLLNTSGFTVTAGTTNASTGIQIMSPHGGETWLTGVNNNVWWTHNLGPDQLFEIDISTDGGQTWTWLTQDARSTLPGSSTNQAAFQVRMPYTPTNNARIRVMPAGNQAAAVVSPNPFTLVQPQIAVTSPSQGTSVQVGSDTDITWSINGDGGVYPAKLEVTHNGGITWEDSGTFVPQGLEHRRPWHVSGPPTTQAEVRVTLYDGNTTAQVGPTAVSGAFTISGGPASNTPCGGPSPSIADAGANIFATLAVAHIYENLVGQNTHWVNGTSVGEVGGAGITVGEFKVLDATHASVMFFVDTTDSQFRPGPRTLKVTTATTTCTEVVSGQVGSFYRPPVLTSITPASAAQGAENLTLTLNGEFASLAAPQAGANGAYFGAGITLAGPFTVTSTNSTTTVINIAANAEVGPHDVTIFAGNSPLANGATLPGGFTVTAATGSGGALPPGFKSGLGVKQHNLTVPTIGQVTPNTGAQGATNLSVTLTGSSTNFVQGTTTADFGPGITLASPLTVTSSTSATAILNIGPQATVGPHAVALSTGAETATMQDGFTVNIPATPSGSGLATIDPNRVHPGPCTLPLRKVNVDLVTPGSVHLSWPADPVGKSVWGASPWGDFPDAEYEVLRSDLGQISHTKAANTIHLTRLDTRSIYSYRVIGHISHTNVSPLGSQTFNDGCWSTDVSVTAVAPETPTISNVTFTVTPASSHVHIWWKMPFQEQTGFLILGPGLPFEGKEVPEPPAVDTSNGPPDPYARDRCCEIDITGVPSGSQSWLITPYWDTPEGRVIHTSTGAHATATLP